MIHEVDELTKRRMEHNEQLFKTVNEEIDARSDSHGKLEYLCECADTSCSATIRLTHSEYEGVRARADHYFMLPDHIVPEVEKVVEQNHGWIVVVKI